MEEKNSWEETDARGLERLRPCSRRRHGRGRSFGLLAPADATRAFLRSVAWDREKKDNKGTKRYVVLSPEKSLYVATVEQIWI
jgi:hypothetical protein